MSSLIWLYSYSYGYFWVKPIARLIFKVRNFQKPYNFVPIPTIKYYRILNDTLSEARAHASA